MVTATASPLENLSSYARGLSGPAMTRYRDKISLICGYDPMLGVPRGAEVVVPPVDASDLVSYLVLETSFYSAQQFKARKGLEAYNQFLNGWIKECKSVEMHGKHLTIRRVSKFP